MIEEILAGDMKAVHYKVLRFNRFYIVFTTIL